MIYCGGEIINKNRIRYRIRYSHASIGKDFATNKKEAVKIIRNKLARFPYATAYLEVPKKGHEVGDYFGWKHHSSYEYRRSKKTGRYRLVKK